MNKKTIKKIRIQLNKRNYPSEAWFERLLNKNNISGYRRNVCLENKYFGDFVFRSLKLVIEIDGSSHFGKAEYDYKRDHFLSTRGWKVFRVLANNEECAKNALKIINDLPKKRKIEIEKKAIVKADQTRLNFEDEVNNINKYSNYKQELLANYLRKRPKKKGLILLKRSA
jgi:very-short-patch-repair endonuclease